MLYKQAEKAWKETNQVVEDVFAQWLKAGGVTQEQAREMCNDLRKDFVEAIEYRKTPVGLVRNVLLEMMADSLAGQATDQDKLAEHAAAFGRVLVELALDTFNEGGLKQ